RREALSDKPGALVWHEWSVPGEVDLDDRAVWASVNPAVSAGRLQMSVVEGERARFSDEGFARERLGQWAADLGGLRLISAAQWRDVGVAVAPSGGVRVLGVAYSADGKRQAVGGAVKHAGGVHVEAVGAHTGSAEAGVRQLVRWLCDDPERPNRWESFAQIVVVGRAGAPLVQALRDRGVGKRVLIHASGPEYFAACAMFLDAVRDGSLTHSAVEGQKVLDESVAVCHRKDRGQDGSWSWEPTTDDGDETPVEAVTVALWGAKTTRRDPSRTALGVVM